MSNRTNIDAATLTALQAANVTMFLMVELDFDAGRQYLADIPVGMSVSWDGHTYTGAAGIGTIEPITESDAGAHGIALTMAAIDPSVIGTAIAEDAQGRECLIRLAIVDGATLRVDPCVWRGVMDVIYVEDDGARPILRLTAEHQMIAWQQPSGALFSDAEQQARYAGDKFFAYAAQIAEATIVWPSAEFFQR